MKSDNEHNLRIGKAAEYIVVADLLLQGFNAFLSDQGLEYDVVVETKNGLKSIQVKATRGMKSWAHSRNVYRFSTRKGNKRNNRGRKNSDNVDYFAFVALDSKKIAYIRATELIGSDGETYKQCLEFFDKDREPENRKHKFNNKKYIDDYMEFEE